MLPPSKETDKRRNPLLKMLCLDEANGTEATVAREGDGTWTLNSLCALRGNSSSF